MSLQWTENFSGYTPGNDTISAPWANPGNTLISTAIFHSSPQSLGTGRGGNGSTPLRPIVALLTQSQDWSLDFWVYLPTGNSLNNTTSSAGITFEYSGSGGQINMKIQGNGDLIMNIPFGATLFSGLNLGALDTWHHCLWTCHQAGPTGGTSTFSIDGVAATPFSGDTRNSANNPYSDEVIIVGQTIGPSPTAEFYVDDLTMYNSIYVPPMGGPISSLIF
jgi:hypothetical protein